MTKLNKTTKTKTRKQIKRETKKIKNDLIVLKKQLHQKQHE